MIMAHEAALQLNNIDKRFGGIHALDSVSMTVEKGEVHALLGENGAGKSTLIKILTGVHKADSGEILLNGEKVVIHDPIDARKKGIAAIYQELSLIESLTVGQNIFLGSEPVKGKSSLCDNDALYKKSSEYLNEFHINIDPHKKVSELGMGQKRIIEIIKALVINANILLLDEPTTGMSQAEIEILFSIMRMLKRKKVTMIYISHYLDEVYQVCDRATVFRDGHYIDTYNVSEVDESTLIESMIGKKIKVEQYHIPRDTSTLPELLSLDGYQTDLMKEPVSFTLHEGEIIGVTGIVGAGKSEIANSIFGNAKHLRGSMYYKGEKVSIKSPYDTKRYGMALVPEDRKAQGLFLSNTVSRNICIANIEQSENNARLISSKKEKAISEKIGRRLNLKPLDVSLRAQNLSGGNQQKVVLAKWLIGKPEIVLMDEPTRGIDIGAKVEIYQIISKLSDDGKGIIVFSSDFDELLGICDRILVVYKGKIIRDVPADEASSAQLLALAVGGEHNGKSE